MNDINYLQVIGPVDECAKHGREHMLRSRPRAPMLIDGQPHGEPIESWYCLVCMHENTERERVRADKAEEDLARLCGVVKAYTEAPGQERGGCFKDMDATLQTIETGHLADRGWPTAYGRLQGEVEELQTAQDKGREETQAHSIDLGLRFK